MARKGPSPLWLLLLLGLLGFGGSGGDDTPPKNDDDKPDDDECPAGMVKNLARLRLLTSGLTGAALDAELAKYPLCVPETCPVGTRRNAFGECVSSDLPPPPTEEDDDCPPGMVKNLARLKLLGSGLKGEALEAELAKYPLCVPKDCPIGTTRNDFGECMPVDPTPTGPDPDLDDPKIFNVYPTPRTFYQVVTGDYELGVAKKYAQSCLFYAAKARGFTDEEANAWATDNNTAPVRYAAVAFFSCVPENDMVNGTYRFQPCSGQHSGGCTHPGSNGRGIRFIKNTGNTKTRIIARLPWRRGPVLGKPGDSPSSSSEIPNNERVFPLIYLGEPDYDSLFESNGTVWQPSKAKWADGVTTYRMPPKFRALGFEGVPDGVEWGC